MQVHPSNLTVYRLHVNLNRTKINIESNIITSTYILKHRYIYTGSPLCIVESDKITGKISETNKVRVMVIPIVAMLAVTMIVAGYRDEGEPIEVDEGYDEMNLEYLPGPNESETFYDKNRNISSKNATATTYIGESNNTLEFRIIVQSIMSDGYQQHVKLNLFLDGCVEEKNNLEKNLFELKGLDGNNGSNYVYNFDLSFFEGQNVDLWSSDQFVSGSSGESESFIGFDIKENEFSASARVTWDIPRAYWNETYTIRFESIARGLSQDIVSTIDVQIQEEVK